MQLLTTQAVKAAEGEWGSQALPEQQAEDQLAFACERAPSEDDVIVKLRAAFKVCTCASCRVSNQALAAAAAPQSMCSPGAPAC